MNTIENINWYPGHMKKTRELIAANLKLVDLAIEVCDARIPISSRNPVFDELLAHKDRILILNKRDLANEAETKRWLAYFRDHKPKSLRAVLSLNGQSGDGLQSLFSRLEKIEKEKVQTGSLRLRNPLKLMIVGVPNSGKSSLINRLMRKRSAQTGDRPGVTRGKQWLTLENGMQLLDTPGILWPKFEDPNAGVHLAICGAIRDEVLDIPGLCLALLHILMRDYPEFLMARYGLESDLLDSSECEEEEFDEDGAPIVTDPALNLMGKIAEKRGYLLPGKRIDYERTARQVLDEFRAAKIGPITLEKV
ncbi:MAG: ribosome biogenesis GTPase YlqF [Clostridiales Family XIII bacterium]|jgi:ribosome biogenesis GTPase A|nr:ribosome biogenesis GTPase YlqF [Clostridiales Family XIII bacterium]